VNIESISSIARSRRAELFDVAARRRAERACHPGKARPHAPLRIHLARAVLALGDVCYVLGDALIPSAE
jgi:hypothetical protein